MGPVFGPELPPEGPFAVSARIRGSLAASLSGEVGPDLGPALTQVTKRILMWWLDLRRDLHPGDEVRLVYRVPFEKEPVIEALWLRAQALTGPRSVTRFQPGTADFPRYYTTDGEVLEPVLIDGPIESYEQVTSLLGDGRGHKGVDFKAPLGTPIKAPFDGKVVRRNWSTRRNGLCLEIESADGKMHALFLHLATTDVRLHQSVVRGQRIGTTGNTGHSTAPHLHYQLEDARGRVLDPYIVHRKRRERLIESEQAALRKRWRQVEAILAAKLAESRRYGEEDG